MKRGARSDARAAWIVPGTGLAFSVLVAFLAPLYARSYGDQLPALTRAYFAAYPLWIVLCIVALATIAFADQVSTSARWDALRRGLDLALNLGAVLIIAVGLIALFLPLLVAPIPG